MKPKRLSGNRPATEARAVKKSRRPQTNVIRAADGTIRFRQRRKRDGIVVDVDAVILTDAEWLKIAASSPLPPNAREDIRFAVAVYRDAMAPDRTDLKTKRLVKSMRGHAQKLLSGAAKLQEDTVFLKAGISPFSNRTGPTSADLEKVAEHISAFDQVLADAQRRMKMKRGRKQTQSLEFLILMLAQIPAKVTQEFVKRSIKTGIQLRPTNRFIRLCVSLADPSIPSTLVDSVLTRVITEHWFAREAYGFDTATSKPLT
jgi:hypothetical protein